MLGVIALGLLVHGCVRHHGRRRADLLRGTATDQTHSQLLLSPPARELTISARERELASPHEAGGPARQFVAAPARPACGAGTGLGVGSSLCGRAPPREDEAALLGAYEEATVVRP